jgi:hypothetical protein
MLKVTHRPALHEDHMNDADKFPINVEVIEENTMCAVVGRWSDLLVLQLRFRPAQPGGEQ